MKNLRALLSMAVIALGTGCGPNPCSTKCASPPALVLAVVDAVTGAELRVAEVTVNGSKVEPTPVGSCFGGGVCTHEYFNYRARGRQEVVIQTAGYVDASFTVDFVGDQFECAPVSQARTVHLKPLTATAVFALDASPGPAGCHLAP